MGNRALQDFLQVFRNITKDIHYIIRILDTLKQLYANIISIYWLAVLTCFLAKAKKKKEERIEKKRRYYADNTVLVKRRQKKRRIVKSAIGWPIADFTIRRKSKKKIS